MEKERDSKEESRNFKGVAKALIAILVAAVADALSFPDRLVLDILLIPFPGVSQVLKVLYAMDRWSARQNDPFSFVLYILELIYISASSYFQWWLFGKQKLIKRLKNIWSED